MLILEQIVIPLLFLALGWFGKSLFVSLSYNVSRKLANRLMDEVNELREKVLDGYKLADTMELALQSERREKLVLRDENARLTSENARLEGYIAQMRKQYDGVMEALEKVEFDIKKLPGFHGAPPPIPNHMKKVLIFLLLCFALAVQAFTQTQLNDSVTIIRKDSLDTYLIQLAKELELADSTNEFRSVYDLGVKIYGELAYITKTAPKPNTKEGVNWWTDIVVRVKEALPPLITILVTMFLGFFKKNPEATVSRIRIWFSKIQTRYLVVASGAIATLAGLLFFKEGGWTWMEALGTLLVSIVGGVGIVEVLSWFGINLKAKKV